MDDTLNHQLETNMNIKTISFALFIATSSNLQANEIPHNDQQPHHEATQGGIGLLAGSLIAGPIGAIIGGSFGVMNGHQQSQTETISEQQQLIQTQQHAISTLETELSEIMVKITQANTNAQQLAVKLKQEQHTYIDDLNQFANSYQFDIYFLTNSSDIHPQAKQGLDKLSQLLQRYPQLRADLESHSDWRGTADDNCLLSKQRLSKVNNHLTQSGVNPSQLLASNYGEQNAYDNSSWNEGLFYDRRVTINLSYFGN